MTCLTMTNHIHIQDMIMVLMTMHHVQHSHLHLQIRLQILPRISAISHRTLLGNNRVDAMLDLLPLPMRMMINLHPHRSLDARSDSGMYLDDQIMSMANESNPLALLPTLILLADGVNLLEITKVGPLCPIDLHVTLWRQGLTVAEVPPGPLARVPIRENRFLDLVLHRRLHRLTPHPPLLMMIWTLS